jgi:exodeoxyribonuclease III
MPELNLVCWNVNGIRSIIKKDFLKDVKAMNPDILCLQETKAPVDEVKNALELMPGYKGFINSSKARQGYSGTAIITRHEPLSVTYDMAVEEHDKEGRVITAEFTGFFLVTVYTPNSGEGLKRLEYRGSWDQTFTAFVSALSRRKPVIICGDLNVAHQPIDLARPKENYNKSAGYTQQEIDGLQRLLDVGFVDTFRHFYPDEVKYTYWNYMFNARARNMGWRIDYFLASKKIMDKVKEVAIYNEYFGSDHCPIGLKIAI